jgi:hypothetical protein
MAQVIENYFFVTVVDAMAISGTAIRPQVRRRI